MMKTRRQRLWIPAIVALFLATLFSGCKNEKVGIVGLCPEVKSTVPIPGASNVPLNQVITATFNEKMNPVTIIPTSFIIQGVTPSAGISSSGTTVTTSSFTPSTLLSPFTSYTATIKTTVKDLMGNALQADYTWTFKTIPEVTLSASPVLGGTTTGAGTFAQGSLVTVTAIPNTGYTFTNWTYIGTVVSTSASYQFTMDGNRALVANFTPVVVGNFAVVLSSNPFTGGTTGGAGSYTAGATVNVIAYPNPLYNFVNWTEGATIVSTSSNYQFALSGNRTLVANYSLIPAGKFAVILSSNPIAGGTTNGSGSFNAASSVIVTATPNTGYNFVNWTDNGTVASTTSSYTFTLNANRTLVANFALNTYTLNVTATNGTVAKIPTQATYNHGTSVTLTATPNTGYIFSSWSGDATGSANPLTVTMDGNKNITANFTQTSIVGPGIVNLGTAGNFVALTKTGISTTGVTSITGNIGVSPAAASAITGFGLIMDASNQFSHTPIVTGKVYASDYSPPTPVNMTTAVSDMETAYTTANNLVTPAPIVDLYAGDISGRTLPQGLYKWSTGLLITNAGITLSGGANDTWVFQIAQNLTVNNSAIITLTGVAQPKNIFCIVAGQATLGSNVDFSGIILSKTLISLNTGAKVTGRLLAQTAVTLNASTVIQP
jgi:uncharacterized repeat protein (TIGR02543 family)